MVITVRFLTMMKSKLIFIYFVVLIFFISLFLADFHEGFVLLSMISMGFIWGFMANESLRCIVVLIYGG